MPCPANLMRKIAINNKDTDDIFEKKKDEKESNKITNKANFEIFMSSIFSNPNQKSYLIRLLMHISSQTAHE